jgi:Family of unknown function (DUF6105)
MKYFVAIWAAPLVLFWGWYFLSLNDINFGTIYLTRQLHDVVFQLYGQILGVDPGSIPGMIAEACFFDSLIVMAIWAFRNRVAIVGWTTERYRRTLASRAEPVLSEAQPEEPSA